MKAEPKKRKDDILQLLPKHLHGGHGGECPCRFADGTPGQHHAKIPELCSNALGSTTHPDAEQQNRDLNMDIARVFADRKPLVKDDQGVPRFVIVWRIYPNPDNPVVATG